MVVLLVLVVFFVCFVVFILRNEFGFWYMQLLLSPV